MRLKMSPKKTKPKEKTMGDRWLPSPFAILPPESLGLQKLSAPRNRPLVPGQAMPRPSDPRPGPCGKPPLPVAEWIQIRFGNLDALPIDPFLRPMRIPPPRTPGLRAVEWSLQKGSWDHPA